MAHFKGLIIALVIVLIILWGDNAMINEYFKAGDHAIWCGFDEVEIVDISGEWATIRFPDTHSTTITNTKHLGEGLNNVGMD